MPNGILATPFCVVNENSTNSSTAISIFENIEVNDVLENINVLLKYTKKGKKKGAAAKRRHVRARVGRR